MSFDDFIDALETLLGVEITDADEKSVVLARTFYDGSPNDTGTTYLLFEFATAVGYVKNTHHRLQFIIPQPEEYVGKNAEHDILVTWEEGIRLLQAAKTIDLAEREETKSFASVVLNTTFPLNDGGRNRGRANDGPYGRYFNDNKTRWYLVKQD